mmetsp:Transcript_49797/g.98829  ORF Transcript_49797/g.98829 Transcript_49797/m.98829 type:complete len:621 (+) Transcript_49797:69-1931(+)
MPSLFRGLFPDEEDEWVDERDDTVDLAAELLQKLKRTPCLPRVELRGLEVDEEPHSVYFKLFVLLPGDHETSHIVMKCYRHFVEFHSELAAELPPTWLPQLPTLSSEIDPMDLSFRLRLGDYLECIAGNKEFIWSVAAVKFFHLSVKDQDANAKRSVPESPSFDCNTKFERCTMQQGVPWSQTGAVSRAASMVPLSEAESSESSPLMPSKLWGSLLSTHPHLLMGTGGETFFSQNSSSGPSLSAPGSPVEQKSVSVAGKSPFASPFSSITRAPSHDSLPTVKSDSSVTSSPFSPSAFVPCRLAGNLATAEIHIGGTASSFGSATHIGGDEVAGLPFAAVFNATSKDAPSTFADKSGGISPASIAEDLVHTQYAQTVVSAQQDAKTDPVGLTEKSPTSDCTSKVALQACAAEADQTHLAMPSRFLPAQSVRQMPALENNAKHDMSYSVEGTQRCVSSNSSALRRSTRKVRFAPSGGLRVDMDLAPMAAALSCTNTGALPARETEANRSLPNLASKMLTNTEQAASTLQCTGKATPSAYLAGKDLSPSVPALDPQHSHVNDQLRRHTPKQHSLCSSTCAASNSKDPVASGHLHLRMSYRPADVTKHMSSSSSSSSSSHARNR